MKLKTLFNRIIKSFSNKSTFVADSFCDSGITSAVVNKFNRHFIHCNLGINSILTVSDRLISTKKARTSFYLLEMKDIVSLFLNTVHTIKRLKSIILDCCKIGNLSKYGDIKIKNQNHASENPQYLRR